MASILVSSQQHLVVVLFGQTVDCRIPDEGGFLITASGVILPEGPDALNEAVGNAILFIETAVPPDTFDIGPIFGLMFRFRFDTFGQQAYYGLHDGIEGIKENTSLPAVLNVLKSWLNGGGGGG